MEELTEYLQVLLNIGFLNPDHSPIVSFEVKPLNIKELSKKYRISSIPIREALIFLEVDKIVCLIPKEILS